LKGHAGAERRAVRAGPIADDADERGPEGKGELIDPDHEPDERAEALARPLDGEDETGECRQVPDAQTEERAAGVVFFPTAAAAERAGFRPCLRCRPETAPGTPAWHGAAATVSRALRLIDGGFLDDGKTVEDLADTLGMTTRHLRRLFVRHAGASPAAVATTRRVQRAKTLVDETALPMSAIAFAAGFGSIRRFNTAFRAVYRRAPTRMRRAGRRRGSARKAPNDGYSTSRRARAREEPVSGSEPRGRGARP